MSQKLEYTRHVLSLFKYLGPSHALSKKRNGILKYYSFFAVNIWALHFRSSELPARQHGKK